MPALDEYLTEHASELNFDLGSVTSSLASDPGSNRAWAQFSLGVSQQIWSALPASIRSGALAGLQDAIDLIEQAADLAVSAAIDAVMDAAGIVEAIPIVGAIIEAAVVLVESIVGAVKGVKQLNYAYSVQDKNIEQQRTFEASTSPNEWALGNIPVRNFKHYATGSDRVDRVYWRSRPCIVPSYRDAAVWALPTPPDAIGSCDPGRELDRRGSGYDDFRKESGSDCESFAAVSCLFWPFWSPNHEAKPISWYGKEVYPDNAPFKLDGVDPNKILIVRQQALLSNPATNLRVRGSRLRNAQRIFTQYFRDKVHGMGGMLTMRGNEVKLRTTTADATYKDRNEQGPVDRWQIDPAFDPAHEFGGDVYYYWNANGLIENYGRGPDLADVGVPAFCPPAMRPQWKDLGYSASQLNAVVAGVKGFFTARAAMLRQPYAMKAILASHPPRTFDRMAVAAMRESAATV